MSEQTPTISIIMPIYKVAQYLRGCLGSIKEQTYTDFEVLMIDDGSPDESGSICIEYQQNDPRFHYYRKENGGAASARNYGLSIARGKYFSFIDSDDFLGKDYLKALYDQVLNNHSDIAIISYYMLNEKGKFFVPMNPNGDDHSFDGVHKPEEWIRSFFNRDGMIYTAPWGKLFSRQVFNNLYFPPHVDAGDDQFTIWRAYVNADSISFDNKQEYCYVTNSNSLSHIKVSAHRFGVEAIEEQIAVFQGMDWDSSYMIPLYMKRLNNLYNVSMKQGDFYQAMNAKYKLDRIKESQNDR